MHAERSNGERIVCLRNLVFKLLTIAFATSFLAACASKNPAPTITETPDIVTTALPEPVANDIDTIDQQEIPADRSLGIITEAPELALEYPDSAWSRLRTSQVFTGYESNAAVLREIEYLSSRPDMIARFVARSEPFLVYVFDQLEQENLPLELAVLPYIESAYNAAATSRKGAAGLWQIMLGTARDLNVQQTIWYDGRRDLEESTASAISYLRFLSNKFEQDWLLSLAAYNAGHNKVRKLIERNQRQNKAATFWDLKLPKETKTYVPRFLAFLEILKHPEQYAIELPHIDNERVITSIDVARPVDISALNAKLGLAKNVLSSLNRGYIRDVTPPGKTSWALIVPNTVSAQASSTIAQMPVPDLSNHTLTHRIQRGETLSHIARRYGVKISHIQRINNLRSSRIRAGKKLTIPAPVLTAAGNNNEFIGAGKHVVKRGESLWLIARRYDLSVSQISELNELDIGQPLMPGRILTIR